MLRLLHINPSEIAVDRQGYHPSQFKKDLYGVIGAIGAYIYRPINTNRVIYGRGDFFNLLFLNILTNPGHNFTNLNFCDVTLRLS